MNENLDLVEILKDCPKGTKLYSPIVGEVEFDGFDKDVTYPVRTLYGEAKDLILNLTKEGSFIADVSNGECMLFPSKDQRDWSKFHPKKPKFDPKTLQPFDKVIVKDYPASYWNCDFFSRVDDSTSNHKFITIGSAYKFCIPYNDDTKHLVDTKDEVPEYYRYWEE